MSSNEKKSFQAIVGAVDEGLLQQVPPWLLSQEVLGVSSDSRESGPGVIFVAVKGTEQDGNDFVQAAINNNCLAVVVEKPFASEETPGCILEVEDSQVVLGDLVSAWYGEPASELQLIGITGTNGKTTCSWILEETLISGGLRPGVIGTVNYRYYDGQQVQVIQEAPLTTPGPELLQKLLRIMADNGVTHVIMEVSSHALVQKRIGRLLFDAALFTNLSRDHLDYHLDMEHYFTSKQLLFSRHLKKDGVAVVVESEEALQEGWTAKLAENSATAKVIRCGRIATCDVRASKVKQSLEGFSCTLSYGEQQATLHSSLTGEFNVMNILAAAGVGLGLGLDVDTFVQGVGSIRSVPGRLERVSLPAGDSCSCSPMVFVDYAHTPDALENVLEALGLLAPGRIICVFGCGGERDRGKRAVMGHIAAEQAGLVVVTSDNPRRDDPDEIIADIIPGVHAGGKEEAGEKSIWQVPDMVGKYVVIPDRRQAIHFACSFAGIEDTVLIAGKGHEDYQILGTQKQFFDDRVESINGLLKWNTMRLLAATGGCHQGCSQQITLGKVSTDTRSIVSGDVFVALKGENFDGHAFCDTAVKNGAAALVVQDSLGTDSYSVPVIKVENTLEALGNLAAYKRKQLGTGVRVVAITGSSGKTTVKEMTAAILAKHFPCHAEGLSPVLKTEGNLNNQVGLPLSLLRLQAHHIMAVLEMGMNSFGEIKVLAEIAAPDIGCITNIGTAHIEGLGSVAGIAKAKGELFVGMGEESTRVINFDDKNICVLARQFDGKQVGFAVTARGRSFNPLVQVTRQKNLGEQGMRFTLNIGDWKQRLTVPAPGEHSVSNCAAAAAIATASGVGPETIVAGLQAYTAMDKRMVISQLPGGLNIVNDTYNANPQSVKAALSTVAGFGSECKRVAALGDMLELGQEAEAAHKEVGKKVAEAGFDILTLTGEYSQTVRQGAIEAGLDSSSVHVFTSPQAIAGWIYHQVTSGVLGQGDWLLAKGSRGMRMESLLEHLEKSFEFNPVQGRQ